MNHRSSITIEEIEEELKKMGVEDTIVDHGNGLYTINVTGHSMLTNRYGVDMFNKALMEEAKKLIDNDRIK